MGQYFAALNRGDTEVLETVWPSEVVVYDPRAGEIRGHRQLRRFVRQNQAWLGERGAWIETVTITSKPDPFHQSAAAPLAARRGPLSR